MSFGIESLRSCDNVLRAVDEFRASDALRYLTGGEWKMFGRFMDYDSGETLIDMLTKNLCHRFCSANCVLHTLSRGEAKKLVDGGSVFKTDLDDNHFVFSNKRGDRIFGCFRIV